LGGRWELVAGVNNLLDESYEVSITGNGLITTGTPFMVHAGFRFRANR
jgi:outer membrane receptor protein involved in Fe transport